MEPRQEQKPKQMAPQVRKPKPKLQIVKLEERIAPSNGNFPPGQFPSGNP